ncbi:MAG: ferric iron uptake transcriptional regulator [Xanthomonadales bacterium]|nr:ferric iron uptake transcriptional regulator [Xanthomonadales bacterium]
MIVETLDLKNAGLKVTQPRLRILQLLASSDKRHHTADDLYRMLLAEDSDIGLATVYRVLNQFESAGLVAKHNFEGGQASYELDEGEHHDHMVCLESGDVTEFISAEIETLQEKIADLYNYEIVDHSLVIYVRPKKRSK